MATRIRILTPNGRAFYTHFTEHTDKREIAERLLKPWERYCELHWLSHNDGKPYAPERKVKLFLDSLAYLLLRDNPEGTLTLYKEYARGSSEIPVSSCPTIISDMFYCDNAGTKEEAQLRDPGYKAMLESLDNRTDKHAAILAQSKPKKPDEPTRSSRLEAIRKHYPACTFSFCRVDTDNCFEYSGIRLCIAEHVEAYRPKQTLEGLLYDMDQVLVVEATNHERYYYDQRIAPIDPDHIEYY